MARALRAHRHTRAALRAQKTRVTPGNRYTTNQLETHSVERCLQFRHTQVIHGKASSPRPSARSGGSVSRRPVVSTCCLMPGSLLHVTRTPAPPSPRTLSVDGTRALGGR